MALSGRVGSAEANADREHDEVGQRPNFSGDSPDAAVARGSSFDAETGDRFHLLAVSFADLGGNGPQQRSIKKGRHQGASITAAV